MIFSWKIQNSPRTVTLGSRDKGDGDPKLKESHEHCTGSADDANTRRYFFIHALFACETKVTNFGDKVKFLRETHGLHAYTCFFRLLFLYVERIRDGLVVSNPTSRMRTLIVSGDTPTCKDLGLWWTIWDVLVRHQVDVWNLAWVIVCAQCIWKGPIYSYCEARNVWLWTWVSILALVQ